MLSSKVPRFRRIPRFQSSRLPGFLGFLGFLGFQVSRVQGCKHQGSRLVRVLVWCINNEMTSAMQNKFPVRKGTTAHSKHKGSRLARDWRLQGYRAPGIQGCRFQWFQSSKISEFRDCSFQSSPAFQGCNVTGQSSTLAPRSKGCRFPRFQAQFKIEGFQDFRVSAFQLSRVPGFQNYLSRFFRAPWLGFADTWNSHAHQAEKNARRCGAPAKGSFKGWGKGSSITVLARDRRL